MPARATAEKTYTPLRPVQATDSDSQARNLFGPEPTAKRGPGMADSVAPEREDGATAPPRGVSVLRSEIKAAVCDDVSASCKELSREAFCDLLTEAIGEPVSLARLIKIYNQAKTDKRLPADWVPAWCEVTGSHRVLEILCMEAGGHFVKDETMRDAELGQRVRQAGSVLRGILAEVA